MARWLRPSDEIADGSPDPHRSGRNELAFLLTGILVLTAGLLFFRSPEAGAKTQFLSSFTQAYPNAVGTPLDSCGLCHTDPAHPSENNRNQYARDWENGDIGDKDFLDPKLVNRDSDGDGVSNGLEIQQLSLPGDPSSSTPPTTTTTVPGTPPNGQDLYAARCAACHGANAGNLNGTTRTRTTFISITLNGQGNMPAQSGLSSAEVGAIWDYVTGAVPTTTTSTQPGATTTTTQPAGGATVWAQTCASCHGANGGNVVPTGLSGSQLRSIVSNGKGTMPAFAWLGSAQVNNVADYLLGLSAPPTTVPGATTTTTAPRSGAAVYAASCALCHGADGGNLRGNGLALSKISSVVTGGQGSMSGFSGRLSPAEISNVSQYVRSVGTSSGVTTTTAAPGTASGATIYGQQCALCHGADGGNLRGHNLSSSKISSVVAGGQGSMSGFSGRLSPVDIDAVSQYVLSVGASSGVTTTTAAPGSTPSGANLFMQNCSGCHGLHGEGGSGGAVAGTSLTRSQTISLITGGASGMPAYRSQLSAAEIAAIADHVLSLAGKGGTGGSTETLGTEGEVVIPPELVEGHALFGRFCAACHGANGEGGLGGAVAGIGLSAVELDEIIRNGVGSMPGFAGQMSDGELAALVSYTLAVASGQEFSSAGTTTTTDTNTQGSGGIAGPKALGGSVPDEPASSSPVTVIVVSLLAGLVAAGAAVLWARLGRNLTR